MMSSMDREAWLAERRTGIGSSDIGQIVLRDHPWGNALGVWMDKLGMLPPGIATAPKRWGLLLENVVAAAYEEETGRTVTTACLMRHGQHRWMICTPDRITHDGGRLVELKTASAWEARKWGEPGTDEIPTYYLTQAVWQMAVTGIDVCDVPVLIGGQDFRIYTVERSQRTIERMISVGADFWGHVQRREPPQPDWSHPRTAELIDALYQPTGGTVQLDDHAAMLATEYVAAGDAVKHYKSLQKERKAHLIALLKDATVGLLPGGAQLRRKMIHNSGYTVQPYDYPSFSIKKARVQDGNNDNGETSAAATAGPAADADAPA